MSAIINKSDHNNINNINQPAELASPNNTTNNFINRSFLSHHHTRGMLQPKKASTDIQIKKSLSQSNIDVIGKFTESYYRKRQQQIIIFSSFLCLVKAACMLVSFTTCDLPGAEQACTSRVLTWLCFAGLLLLALLQCAVYFKFTMVTRHKQRRYFIDIISAIIVISYTVIISEYYINSVEAAVNMYNLNEEKEQQQQTSSNIENSNNKILYSACIGQPFWIGVWLAIMQVLFSKICRFYAVRLAIHLCSFGYFVLRTSLDLQVNSNITLAESIVLLLALLVYMRKGFQLDVQSLQENFSNMRDKENIQYFFDILPEGLALIDENLQIDFCNKTLMRMMGSDDEETVFKQLSGLVNNINLSTIKNFSELEEKIIQQKQSQMQNEAQGTAAAVMAGAGQDLQEEEISAPSPPQQRRGSLHLTLQQQQLQNIKLDPQQSKKKSDQQDCNQIPPPENIYFDEQQPLSSSMRSNKQDQGNPCKSLDTSFNNVNANKDKDNVEDPPINSQPIVFTNQQEDIPKISLIAKNVDVYRHIIQIEDMDQQQNKNKKDIQINADLLNEIQVYQNKDEVSYSKQLVQLHTKKQYSTPNREAKTIDLCNNEIKKKKFNLRLRTSLQQEEEEQEEQSKQQNPSNVINKQPPTFQIHKSMQCLPSKEQDIINMNFSEQREKTITFHAIPSSFIPFNQSKPIKSVLSKSAVHYQSENQKQMQQNNNQNFLFPPEQQQQKQNQEAFIDQAGTIPITPQIQNQKSPTGREAGYCDDDDPQIKIIIDSNVRFKDDHQQQQQQLQQQQQQQQKLIPSGLQQNSLESQSPNKVVSGGSSGEDKQKNKNSNECNQEEPLNQQQLKQKSLGNKEAKARTKSFSRKMQMFMSTFETVGKSVEALIKAFREYSSGGKRASGQDLFATEQIEDLVKANQQNSQSLNIISNYNNSGGGQEKQADRNQSLNVAGGGGGGGGGSGRGNKTIFNNNNCIILNSTHKVGDETFQLEIKLIPTIQNKKPAIIVLVRDTTESLELIKLKELNNHKQQLLHEVSHELRTPLTAIISLQEELYNQVTPEQRDMYLRPSISSSKVLLNLTNHYLDFAQKQVGKLHIINEPVDLHELLNGIIEIFGIISKKRGINLHLEFDSKNIHQRVLTDPNRLRQIILNLMGNALKFTKKDGDIYVGVKTIKEGSQIEIYVRDTGIGISEENQKYLFKAFARLETDEMAEMNPQGVGLGLMISYSLAKNLNPEGDGLQLLSKKNQGSTFYFTIKNTIAERAPRVSSGRGSRENNNKNNGLGGELQNIAETILDDNDSAIIPSNQVDEGQNIENLIQSYQENQCKFFKEQKNKASQGTGAGNVTGMGSMPNPFSSASTNTIIQQSQVYVGSTQVQNLSSYLGSMHRHNTQLTTQGCILGSTSINNDLPNNNMSLIMKKKCNCVEILCVDDDDIIMLAYDSLLKSEKIQYHTCYNGKDAIKLVKQRIQENSCCPQYKILLIDISMQPMNGSQTCQKIAKIYQQKNLKAIFIACTGYNSEEDRKRFISEGFNLVLNKPFNKQDLTEQLKIAKGMYQ